MLLSGLTTHTAGTLARAADVNANNTAIANVINGNLQEDNFGTLAGVLTWAIVTNVLAQNISTSSTQGAISATGTGVLASSKSLLRLTSGAAQTSGDALAYFDLTSSSSSIPVLSGLRTVEILREAREPARLIVRRLLKLPPQVLHVRLLEVYLRTLLLQLRLKGLELEL